MSLVDEFSTFVVEEESNVSRRCAALELGCSEILWSNQVALQELFACAVLPIHRYA